MAALTCPYCEAKANFTARHVWEQTLPSGGALRYGVWVCDNCRQPIVGVMGSSGEPREYHPTHVAEPALSDVPEDVAADAREAHRCLSVQAFRAAVVMARRAMQSAAYEKGAPEGSLVEQIDWLEEHRLVTPQMKEVAHAIRLAGNLGAHPDKDGLRDVAEPEAEAVIGFLADFLKLMYEIPARLERHRYGSGAR